MSPKEFNHHILPMRDKLYRFAYRMMSANPDAEDVVQEVMLKLWQQGEQLFQIQNLEAWSMRLTKNQCIDKLRARNHAHKAWKEGFDLADQAPQPDRTTESNDTMNYLRRCMEGLPQQLKLALQLRDIEGMSYQEIAEVLEITMAQVKVNIFRARQQLRDVVLKNQTLNQ
jgi:RNA polymerase sigma-70 factor (ECF subfamily)